MREECSCYPIMAGKHEMVRTKAPVPVWVSFSNDTDVVSNGPRYRGYVEGFGLVDQLDHLHNTEWEEEDMSQIRIPGAKPGVHVDAMDEPSLGRVYAPAGAIVEEWWFTFFIHIDLEQLLHFQITPALWNCFPQNTFKQAKTNDPRFHVVDYVPMKSVSIPI